MKTIYVFSFEYIKTTRMIKENIVPLSDGKGKLLTDDIQKAETFFFFFFNEDLESDAYVLID